MICLTGDIHHTSLETNEQRFVESGDSEVKIACRFLKIIEKYGLKVTFYVTGKTFDEEWENLKLITDSNLVEIGGHTYGGLPLGNFSKILHKIIGRCPPSHSPTYGSYFQQKRDIKRMIELAEKKTAWKIISWRSHGYIHDENTYSILAQMGIKMISDEISSKKIFPEKIKEGFISHPINTIPDHDHLYHAHRDGEFVRKAKIAGYGRDDFGSDSHSIEIWGEMVQKQVVEIEEKEGLATILMHPICMYTADKFKTAERLLEFISQYKTILAKEIMWRIK